MKKKIVVIGFLMVFTGLCGCTTQQNGQVSDNTNEAELLNYFIKTVKGTWYDESKIGDGFVHSDDAERYVITGTVRNISNKSLDKITIKAYFYDIDNVLLNTKSETVYYITKGSIDNFEIAYYSYDQYFEVVDSVEFEISAK